MPRIPSPLHDKTVPKSVSKPTVTAEAAATVAESAVAPARKAKAKSRPAAKKAAPAKKVAAPAAKAKAVPAKKAKAAPAKKTESATAAKAKAKDKPAATPAAPKAAKAHKPKLVRDSFTIPKDEYAALEALKARALGLGQHVRKSELLRAGIQALSAMGDRAFLGAVGAVPTLKTGRPKKA